MTKKRRRWVFYTIALSAAAVGLVIYSATREHPDYVRAAKLLPAAQRRAAAMFGPLTWAEWREENGASGEADLERWTEVAETVPETISSQSSANPSSMTNREIFIAEREWFSQIGERVDRLRLRHVAQEDGEDWVFKNISRSQDIVRALRIGMIGAADYGDANAVLDLGRACNKVIAELEIEPSGLPNVIARGCRSLLQSGILLSTVRNRNDVAVIQSLGKVLQASPPAPTVREALAADTRSADLYLEHLRGLDPGEIDEWFDEWGDDEFLELNIDSGQRIAFDLIESATKERPEFKRRVGGRTVDGLEARHLQVLVNYTELFENYFRHKPGALDAIQKLDDQILFSGDWSYELAHLFHWSWFFDQRVRPSFDEIATRAVFELLVRFPEHVALPRELPADLLFADPFGGQPVLYRKTATGFLIYSRDENEIDDGFVVDGLSNLGRDAGFMFSKNRADWGVVVSYERIESEN